MNIQYRLGIEQKAAACRSEVLALIEDYLGDTGTHGEPYLAMILSLEGVTVPADAGPGVLMIRGPKPGDRVSLSDEDIAKINDAGNRADEAIAELEEMVADPKLAPAPKTAAKPKPEPEAAPAVARMGPLDDDERLAILDFHAEGMTSSEIADKLGRTRKGFGLQVKRVIDAAAKDAEETTDAPAPPAEEPPTMRRFTYEPDPAAPLKERSLHLMLNAVGYPEPFTPALDLRLVELIASGWTASGAAAEVGISTDVAKRRWNDLLPEKGIDQQALLLKALRVRAEVAA